MQLEFVLGWSSDLGESCLGGWWCHLFSLCLRTELPILHPFNWLWRPFQYSIRFIAFDTWGHHGTTPALIFLHLFSAYHLSSVAALSILLYSICWDCISLILRCCDSSLACHASWVNCSDSHSKSLYLVTTCGSLQWRHLTIGHLITSFLTGHI